MEKKEDIVLVVVQKHSFLLLFFLSVANTPKMVP